MRPGLILSLFLLTGLMTACGAPAATPPSSGEIETIVAATFQALTPQVENTPTASATPLPPPPAATPTATLLPTAVPAVIHPIGAYVPYVADRCEIMRANFEQAIGAPVTTEPVAFNDFITGATGTACRVYATGNGATYGIGGPFGTLQALVTSLGWTQDSQYGAAGATGMVLGYRNGSALGVLSVGWRPSADANCPTNQPIGACNLTPEQKLFEVKFDIVQVVAYQPLPAEQCAMWLAALQAAVPVTLVAETVEFIDLEGNVGTACQVRGAGTGADLANMGEAANALGNVIAARGWALGNGADGPTGTLREYTLSNQTAVVTVRWRPSADANCPGNQPISACNLTPEQKIFTLTVAFAQK